MPFFPPDTGAGSGSGSGNGSGNGYDNGNRFMTTATTFTDNTTNMGREDVPSRIRMKNRRKRYLDLHPEYFASLNLELADPLLYDRLIRRFQTPAEREAEGRRKGYSGTLEADLLRSEAKLDALAHPDPNQTFSYRRGPDGEILAEEEDEVPSNKEEGYTRWKWEMEMRFVRGGDMDFEYEKVDESEQYDDFGVEEQEAEERWFDQEEAKFVTDEGLTSCKSKELRGETGVQDF